jgi:hypothetical protein
MTIGDKSAQSYGWKHKLEADVEGGANVGVPAPGFDTRYTDTRHAEATLISNGAVWRTGEGNVEVTFDATEGRETATVANLTGQKWPAGDEIYVYCPHLLAEGDNEWDLKGQIWDLQQRVSALEGATKQDMQKPPKDPSEPRKTVHVGATVTVSPDKASSAPVRAAVPPAKPPNSPVRGPIPPIRPR